MSANDTLKPAAKSKGFNPAYIIGGAILVAALFVIGSSFSSGIASLEVVDIATDGASFIDRKVKLVGIIKEDSVDLVATAGVQETRFTIHDGMGNEVRIIYPHNPPDPFKVGRECTVEGKIRKTETGVEVLCSKLVVKCPSKYQGEGEAGPADQKSREYYEKKYGDEAQDALGPQS